MGNEYIKPKEAAKILQMSDRGVRDLCEKGRLIYKKTISGKRKKWLISYADCIRLKSELIQAGKIRTTEKNIPPKPNYTPREANQDMQDQLRIQQEARKELIENEGIIKNRDLDKSEAERLLKLEQAIERQRKNLIEDKRLVYVDEVILDIKTIFRRLVEDQRQMIDKWRVKFSLGYEVCQSMQSSFNDVLKESFNELIKHSDTRQENNSSIC